MRFTRVLAASFLLLLAMLPTANSQTITGQIAGRLTDPAGAIVSGAEVRLINDLTKQVRVFQTDSVEGFGFTNLIRGNYSVHIVHPGLKAFDQEGITASDVERGG